MMSKKLPKHIGVKKTRETIAACMKEGHCRD